MSGDRIKDADLTVCVFASGAVPAFPVIGIVVEPGADPLVIGCGFAAGRAFGAVFFGRSLCGFLFVFHVITQKVLCPLLRKKFPQPAILGQVRGR